MFDGLTKPVRSGWQRYSSWVGESPSTRNVFLLLYLLRKHGASLLFRAPYDAAFYDEHLPMREAYVLIAERIFALFEPKTVCDFGCGNGYILSALNDRGVDVQGIEGSPIALDYIDGSLRDRVRVADLSQPVDVGQYDLVISTEVAEHLPKHAARNFVGNLTSAAAGSIVFSAAAPGQWGDGHINCQPKQFWIDLFADRGWVPDESRTKDFVASIGKAQTKLPWIDNFTIFRKKA